MKSKIIIAILTLGSLIGFSQENITYKTFDGTAFTELDTIILGSPYKGNYYSTIKEYYYNSKYSNGYKKVNHNLTNLKVPIRSIHKNTAIFSDDVVILKVGNKGVLKAKYHINIEEAVKKGEVIILSKEKTKIVSTHIEDDLVFCNYVKQSGENIDGNKEEYLFRFKNDLYDKTHEDEFEYHSSLKKGKDELTIKLDSLSDSTVYYLNAELNFQQYDFENKGFPLNEKDIAFNLLRRVSTFSSNSKAEYSKIVLKINNFANFAFLHMSPEDAKSLIARRKDTGGRVNRELYARIYFTVKGSEHDENKIRVLLADVEKVEVYEFQDFQGNFLGEIFDLEK